MRAFVKRRQEKSSGPETKDRIIGRGPEQAALTP